MRVPLADTEAQQLDTALRGVEPRFMMTSGANGLDDTHQAARHHPARRAGGAIAMPARWQTPCGWHRVKLPVLAVTLLLGRVVSRSCWPVGLSAPEWGAGRVQRGTDGAYWGAG